MHPIGKIIIGALMVISSVWLVLSPEWAYLGLLPALITVIKGVVPALVFLMGLFIVWLELDELRIEKELATEERKPKRRKR